MYDAELYRDRAEVERWRLRDPISVFGDRALAEGLMKDADFALLEKEVAAEIDSAVAFAEAGHLEPVEDLTKYVYSERPAK